MAFNPTTIANLWVPPVWIQAIREGMEKAVAFVNSGAVLRTAQATAIASGPGTQANMPFFRDITEQDDQIQIENTEPDVGNLTAGEMVVPIMNRVIATGATALAAQVSGASPIEEIGAILGTRRAKQRDKCILSVLRGVMGSYGASGGPGALAAMRVDAFIEDGNNAGSTNLMTVDRFLQAKALLGELQDGLATGVLFTHSTILAALERQDVTAFASVSEGPFTIRTYRGIPIVISDRLVRAGSTSGFVYETYLAANGVIAYGEKPQQGDVLDVASLQYWLDRPKNTAQIIDRTRFVMHLNGTKWVGTPAAQSPTNAELQTASNWQLALSSANRCGVVCIRTNG